jgi:hypothetical protein
MFWFDFDQFLINSTNIHVFQVYPDLEVAFVISEEESLFNALSKTVELLEGNTALISQYYYGCIFHELLAFQLACRRAPSEVGLSACLSFSFPFRMKHFNCFCV